MIPAELIEKKRDGIELNFKEIDWFIHNVMNEKIDDCQLSALLMSIYFNGMSNAETKSLVDSMVKSGKSFNFKHLERYVADKHSTGGVGDKISFILVPLLASFDIIVPMVAGRGLAFTGGTIDKLESIPDLQTQKDFNSFKLQIPPYICTASIAFVFFVIFFSISFISIKKVLGFTSTYTGVPPAKCIEVPHIIGVKAGTSTSSSFFNSNAKNAT